MENRGVNYTCGTDRCICRKTKQIEGACYGSPEEQRLAEHDWTSSKAQVNGSMCHITAIFGMSIAGMVINKIVEKQTQFEGGREQV